MPATAKLVQLPTRDNPVSGAEAGLARYGIMDAASPFPKQRIGEILVRNGTLSRSDLRRVLLKQANESGPPLGRLLVDEGLASPSDIAIGLALQRGIWRPRVGAEDLDTDLVDRFGADRCLRHGLVPWRQMGTHTVVATSRPYQFAEVEADLRATFGPVRMAIAGEPEIRDQILRSRSDWLIARAEARPPAHLSARDWSRARLALTLGAPTLAILTAAMFAPTTTFLAGLALVTAMLFAMTGLRVAALLSTLRARRTAPEPPAVADKDLPRIAILVPLLGEANITRHLIRHLSALDYPDARLSILLITEAGDGDTDAALESHALPRRFRRVSVPAGTIRTKPRALNYALDLARGDIVGVYDAEDAPDPDQLRRVAATFADAPGDVACLQGVLDFYNADQNLLSRWFTLDYAAWFRLFLPGLARLGFAIPLGGTTLFFRRDALESLGRWDAHNVTEDADLGIRLARNGWRTEMLASVTREEANCFTLSWIRQRSRWLKGYAVTWLVHMRDPVRLWRDLGPRKFLGFQLTFLGTLVLFLGAPLLWTLWALPFGLSHPLTAGLPAGVAGTLIGLYILSEVVDLTAAGLAVWWKGDRWLIKWLPGLMLYFPLATVACYRGLLEATIAPFFWNKTRHGVSREAVRDPGPPPRSA